jgi:hypothetical protein
MAFTHQPKLLHKFARKKKAKMEEGWKITGMGYKEEGNGAHTTTKVGCSSPT